MEAKGIHREEDLPDTIVTSSKLSYRDRIDVQAAWQKYIDASISSTVNLAEETRAEDIEDLYMYGWEKGLKGITVYRDSCNRRPVLSKESTKNDSNISLVGPVQNQIQTLQNMIDEIIVESLKDDPDTCPICAGRMNHSGGCEECQDCGYSPCSI